MKKHKHGFTLAEVLITLVIIGIIAAMTIPVIFANHRKEETLSRLKKFYSTINQAVLMARANGNDWDYWADSASVEHDNSTSQTVEEFAKQYLFPYLAIQSYKSEGTYLYIYLNDGSYFYIDKGDCIDFVFDTNGDKNPNTNGIDKFAFLYCPATASSWLDTKKIIPYVKKGQTRDELLNICKNSNAKYCTGLLMFDNWQFKKDYPYEI